MNLRQFASKKTKIYLPSLWEMLAIPPKTKVWKKAGIVFIHIPKCAGTTINYALYGGFVGHYTASQIERRAPTLFHNLPSFAITRNPWERLYSSYLFAKQGGTALVPSSFEIIDYQREFATFEAFVTQWLPERKLMFEDPVFHPQLPYVTNSAGDPIVSHLGSVNKLDETYDFIESRIGKKIDAAPLNRVGGVKDYRSNYTYKMQGIFYKKYKSDFDFLVSDF
ncbi:MAG: hypothetical protein JJU08_08965 [Rhodobacteraceae bacterium]|nr:hypothetical protein [Paracoccaceae bacterium]